MANQDFLKELLERYISGDITSEDRQKLGHMLQQPEYEPELDQILRETFLANRFGREENAERTDRFIIDLNKKIHQQGKQVPFRSRQPFYFTRIAAAAVVLFVLIGIGYFLINKKSDKPVTLSQAERFKNDILPGHYGAVLTLSKGSKIVLDSVHNGALPGEGNVQLTKKNDELSYIGNSHELLYNTISTPKGRQWRLTLSDGTKVWLDALSSIHYPVSFQGSERVVEMTGEAYFEVAKDENHPFRVKANGMGIAVLGTQFNVNAYGDEEATRTTLLEGSVRVSASGSASMLKPGEQIAVWENGKKELKPSVDIEEVTAWKNDQFEFNDASIGVILRQLARWYDVEIRYEGKVDQYFIGRISRNEPLSKVLRLLELTGGVRFQIEGKIVTVMK
ncbi:MAG TPA: FecR domain-containing protein [Puia sp.]|nr:FecR domain-containing protein [Puia sp.]